LGQIATLLDIQTRAAALQALETEKNERGEWISLQLLQGILIHHCE
jgi:hypothetical protein